MSGEQKPCVTCGGPTTAYYAKKQLDKTRYSRHVKIRGNCVKCRKKLFNKDHYLKDKSSYLDRVTMRNYGMTRAQYIELRELQDNKCYICEKEHTEDRSNGLCMDHNHSTGEVRAFLCRKCNMAVAIVEDADYVQKLIDYLREFK